MRKVNVSPPIIVHYEETYFDIANNFKSLHIGNEIASGDRGVIYELTNDPTKVIKVMVIGDDENFEMTMATFKHEVRMNELAFELNLGVQLYKNGTFEMKRKGTDRASPELVPFCYFITTKLDETFSGMLERTLPSLSANTPKMTDLNLLLSDLYDRQVANGFMHGDLTHFGNIMFDKTTHKLYFIDLGGSHIENNKKIDINKQWERLKRNIKNDYEDQTAIIDELFNQIY